MLGARAGCALSMNPGDEIGDYRLEALLGHGAMGRVFRATHLTLMRTVAIKVITEWDAVSGLEARQRFRREMKILASVSHPQVVTLYAEDIHRDLPYMVMEFMEGGSLQGWLAAHERVPLSTFARWARQSLEGLSHLHQIDVLHRDLKPANLLLDRQENLKLADLGLARRALNTLITGQDCAIGTPFYMAPEVLCGETATPASDVYSLGMVFQEMLAGGTPYADSDQITTVPMRELGRRILQGERASLESTRPDLPGPVVELVENCLERDPLRRPSARESLRKLEAWMAGRELSRRSAAASTVVSPAPEAGRKASSRGYWRYLLAIGAMITLAALGLDQVRARRSANDTVVTKSTSGREGSPAPSTVTAPVREETIAWMRSRCQEAWELIDRYDRTSPRIETSSNTFQIRAQMLGDSFFRQENGDLSLVFTALGRLSELVERGDEEDLDDPVWFEVDMVAYEAIKEAARSNGFDTGSSMRRSLDRLQKSIAGGGTNSTREAVRHSMLSMFVLFETLSGKQMFDFVVGQENLIDLLWAMSEKWRGSRQGTLVRWNVLARTTTGFIERWLREIDDEHAARLRILIRELACRVAAEIEVVPPPDLEPDRWKVWSQWCSFKLMTLAIEHGEGVSDCRARAVRLLNRIMPTYLHEAEPPRCLEDSLEAYESLLASSKKWPDLGLDPLLLERGRIRLKEGR